MFARKLLLALADAWVCSLNLMAVSRSDFNSGGIFVLY